MRDLNTYICFKSGAYDCIVGVALLVLALVSAAVGVMETGAAVVALTAGLAAIR